MIRISILTTTEANAIELARHLHERSMLMFMTIEDHEELTFPDAQLKRIPMTHLSGMTRALLYSRIEQASRALLGEGLVRIWAEAVTSLDEETTRKLLDGPVVL